ncbi:MAG: UDP-N-acetylmuramate--L-alanine ligase [Clostridia bacterium]
MKVHFIGIDGISMSALAKIMQEQGHKVSGSDLKKGPLTKKLVDNGTLFFNQQVRSNIKEVNPDIVIYTAAINKTNPELLEAKSSSAKVYDRATFLGKLARDYERSIAVAGSHGKTTTTAMLTLALIKANASPTALVGGELSELDGNVIIGESDIFLTEACEYVESFLKIYPYIGVILNIDRDHLDYFKDLNHIVASFNSFNDNISDNGFLVINNDDPNTKKVINQSSKNLVTFGLNSNSTWYVNNISHTASGTISDLYKNDEFVSKLELSVPGNHNIYNALAVISTCDILSLDINTITAALTEFNGTHRRFEKRGTLKGALLIDDYAHHPKEIETTLQAIRDGYPNRRIIVIFQPHTYSRTKTLIDNFASSFNLADNLYVTPTYPAREPYDKKGDSKTLIKSIKKHKDNAIYVDSYKEAAKEVYSDLKDNDLVITMGAGPVDKVIELLLNFNKES